MGVCMSPTEEIAGWAGANGGVLVRPEFLGADGAALSAGHWTPAGHVLVRPGGLAYLGVGGGRPHGQRYREARRDHGEWILLPDHRHLRLGVAPLRGDGDRQRVTRWRAEAQSWAERDLEKFTAGIMPDEPVSGPAVHEVAEYQASWHAVMDDGGPLATVGALLLGDDGELTYEALDGRGAATTEARLWEARRRVGPRTLFEYLCHSGNGVTVEWSLPFTILAPGIHVAATRLMTRLRFEGRPVEHLRELWLSAWPDTVDGALDEADALASAADAPLDEASCHYLDRLRSEHDRIHPPGHLACRRSNPEARGRGAARVEESDAP